MTYDGYVYPDWAQALAWGLALFSFLALPIYALVQIFHPKGSFTVVGFLQACRVIKRATSTFKASHSYSFAEDYLPFRLQKNHLTFASSFLIVDSKCLQVI